MTTARRLLEAIAERSDQASSLARQLAVLDIEARGGAVALDILEGDAFALVRAVQLAEEHLQSSRDRAVAPPPPLPHVSARKTKASR